MAAEIYKYVKENKSRIFVGYQRCKIFDHISPAIIVQDTGIVEQRVKILPCAQNARCHTWQAYGSETGNSACTNWKYSNGKYKKSYDINHEGTDSELWEILKFKVKKYIDIYDYLIKPVGNFIIPRARNMYIHDYTFLRSVIIWCVDMFCLCECICLIGANFEASRHWSQSPRGVSVPSIL